uniref:Uncharacterized protein n=1 Tax=Anopheles farauti TaxID=69004 RepID=A0A182QK38_9DIPT
MMLRVTWPSKKKDIKHGIERIEPQRSSLRFPLLQVLISAGGSRECVIHRNSHLVFAQITIAIARTGASSTGRGPYQGRHGATEFHHGQIIVGFTCFTCNTTTTGQQRIVVLQIAPVVTAAQYVLLLLLLSSVQLESRACCCPPQIPDVAVSNEQLSAASELPVYVSSFAIFTCAGGHAGSSPPALHASVALKLSCRRFGSGSEAVFCRSLNFSDPPRTLITAEWRTGVVSRGDEAIECDFECWKRVANRLPLPAD